MEGEVQYSSPDRTLSYKTWYKVFGDLKSGVRPVVGLHGGPGVSHDEVASLSDLSSLYGLPVILYDQVGTGYSTHFPDKMGDASFWTNQLFLDQLDHLLEHLGVQEDYDILGHSWGGMLGALHAVRQPKGLNRLILANAPSDMRLWEEAQNRLRAELPQDVQDTMKKHEDAGTTSSKEYEDAMGVYYSRHLCTMKPWPAEILRCASWIGKDPTVFKTMNGTSEFSITGLLKGWTIIPDAHKINVPTLLINGRYDQAQDSVVEPYYQEVPNITWVQFAHSSHLTHFEERDAFMEITGKFLTRE